MRVEFLARWSPIKKVDFFSDITPTAKKNGGLQLDKGSSPENYSLKK